MNLPATHLNCWLNVDAAFEQAEIDADQYEDSLAETKALFEERGGLWVGNEYFDLDRAQEQVYTDPEYSSWYQRRKLATNTEELEALGREYKQLYQQLLNRAIEEIAGKALAAERTERLESSRDD